MKEKLVTSLELSKQLKESGSLQESEFYWSIFHTYTAKGTPEDCPAVLERHSYGVPESRLNSEHWTIYSAYLTGELGEIITDAYSHYERNIHAQKYGKWHCKMNTKTHFYNLRANTEAEARGKMLLYLLKEGLK